MIIKLKNGKETRIDNEKIGSISTDLKINWSDKNNKAEKYLSIDTLDGDIEILIDDIKDIQDYPRDILYGTFKEIDKMICKIPNISQMEDREYFSGLLEILELVIKKTNNIKGDIENENDGN